MRQLLPTKLVASFGLVVTSLLVAPTAFAQSSLSQLLQQYKNNTTVLQSSLAFDGSDLVQAIEQSKLHSMYAYQLQLPQYIQEPTETFEVNGNSNYLFNKNSNFTQHQLHAAYNWHGHKFGVVALQGNSERTNLTTQGKVTGDLLGVSAMYGVMLQDNFGMNLVASKLKHQVVVPRYVTILGSNYHSNATLNLDEKLVGANGYIHYNIGEHKLTSVFGLNYSRMWLDSFSETFGDLVANYSNQMFNNLNLQMAVNYKYDNLLNVAGLGVELDYAYQSNLYRWGEITTTLTDGTNSVAQGLIATNPDGLHFAGAKFNYSFTPQVKAEVGVGVTYQRNFYYGTGAKLVVNF